MAYRARLLHHRVKGQADNHIQAMGDAHPAVPGPMLMPLSVILVNPVDNNYVTLAMQDLAPIVAADGAILPATGPGAWDQLKLAGGGRSG